MGHTAALASRCLTLSTLPRVFILQFSDIVFAVVVGDATLRFLAVLCKVAILLVVPADSTARVRQRGHLLTAAEFVSQLYRMLPPAPLWYSFYAAQAEVPALLRTGLSGAYLLVSGASGSW